MKVHLSESTKPAFRVGRKRKSTGRARRSHPFSLPSGQSAVAPLSEETPINGLSLSPVQTGMLFQTLWDPGAGFYIQQFSIRIRRKIDPEIVRRTWQRLTNRHESLRCSFFFDEERTPRMRIHESVSVPFAVEDWSPFSRNTFPRRLRGFLRQDREQAFVLEQAPLMRVRLIRLGPAEYLMVWTSHHLLFDGRSRFILLREFSEIYERLAQRKRFRLPAAGAFSDYVTWLETKDFTRSEPYWRTTLEGVTEPTPIGFNDLAAAPKTGPQRRRRFQTSFTPRLLARLEAYCQKHDLSVNILLQAAWAVVLSRYTGLNDVVFGAPRAGRHAPVPGLKSMVGVFVNTLPVRARLGDTRALLDFLHELRDNWRELRAHEHTPLQDIHRWCQLPRGRDLFDSLVGYERFQLAERLSAEAPWWQGASMELEGWTNFALTIQGYRGTGLDLVFSYDPTRFTDAAIRRLGGHLRTVMTGFLSARAKTIGDLPVLTRAERRKLVVDWNATASTFPVRQDVPSVFAEVVRKHPRATALVLDGAKTSYRELDAASDVVAVWLRSEGIGRGDRVGLLLERSMAQIELILGILKAGAAYVPLDPEYPRERLRFMLADAGVRLVLGEAAHRALVDRRKVRFVDATCFRKPGKSRPRKASLPPPDPDAPAYINYTSGSTGTPKGVLVPHRGILRLVFGVDYAVFGPERTFLHMAPISFDASTFEIWGALLHGARCVLYPHRHPQINDLRREIAQNGVDTLWLTAALFNFIIDEAPEILRPIRQLLTGGEALSPGHVAKALRALPHTQLINGYGPTETTTFACCYPIPRDRFSEDRAVPIGRPIGNTSCHVLDRHGRHVPIGVEGELYIGGAGVALGYINRDELTQERFVPDPFSEAGNARLYRTGDLVAWREDGLIDFRGRVDDQVKIRGFRIEPGEIARALQGLDRVKQAAVLVVENAQHGKSLAAFFTTVDGAVLDAHQLRASLAEHLPAYMIPATFTAVDHIPVTANGKVDRNALLAMQSAEPAPSAAASPLSTELERRLAALWMELIHARVTRADESFFALGGDSLAALRLIHRLHQEFSVEIPFHAFLEAPTIAGLCARLQQGETPDDTRPSLSTFRTFARGDRWPVTRATAEYAKLCFTPEKLRSRTIVRTFVFSGNLDTACLIRAIRWVARRHEALSTHYVVEPSGEVIQLRSRGECPVEIEDLTRLPGARRRRALHEAIEFAANRPFDPAWEWMHRFKLLVLAPDEHALICCFHHLNFDGTSLNVFYRDLSLGYRAFLERRESSLPPPGPQQPDVDAWLEQFIESRPKARSREYWRSVLEDAPLVELPLAQGWENHMGDEGRMEYLALDQSVAERLKAAAGKHGVTLYQLLLASFVAMINRISPRNNDIMVATNVDGRTHGSLIEVIGLFARRLMVRIRVDESERVSTVIRRVAMEKRRALEHLYIPSAEMRKLCPSKDRFANPMDRIFFVHSPESNQLINLPGLTCREIPRAKARPTGILQFALIERAEGIVLRVNHVPEVLPTEPVRSMLCLLDFILQSVASGRDPRLSDLPRLGEPVGAVDGAAGRAEYRIRRIFQEVLERPTVGPHDSFFDLGGDSLLAARLLHRVEKRLGTSLPFCALFENPTPRALARLTGKDHQRADLPAFNKLVSGTGGGRTPARLNTINEIGYLNLGTLRNITRAYRLRGPLDLESLERSLQWVVDRHDALRTRLVTRADGNNDCEVVPTTVRLEQTDLKVDKSGDPTAEIERQIMAESLRVFTVDSFPFQVFKVLRLSDEDHVLLLNFNHLFFDGKSLAVFLADLSSAYEAYSRNREPVRPPPPFQFTDVQKWMQDWLDAGGFNALNRLWTERLRDWPTLSLPADKSPMPGEKLQGSFMDRAFGSKLTARARETANMLGVTFHELNHSVLNALLHSFGNRGEACVGTICCMRTHPEAEGVIGNFGNMVPIRTRFENTPTFRALVKATREVSREALQNRMYPLYAIRQLVPQPPLPDQSPFQVYLVQTPPANGVFKLPGIEIDYIRPRISNSSAMLSFQVESDAEQTLVRCRARPEYFSARRQYEIAELYEQILRFAVDNPDRRIDDFPHLDA